jgi:hypothetical protein
MYFYIQGTKTTPHALMNEGYMKIKGKAVPVRDELFFGNINKKITKYTEEPANTTQVDFNLSHVNAFSKKSVVELLKQLETMNNQGFTVVVNWKYDTDNEDVKELGEILQTMFNFTINLFAL